MRERGRERERCLWAKDMAFGGITIDFRLYRITAQIAQVAWPPFDWHCLDNFGKLNWTALQKYTS